MQRPLLWLCLFFIAGVCAGSFLPVSAKNAFLFFTALLSFTAFFLLFSKRQHFFVSVLIATLCFLLGTLVMLMAVEKYKTLLTKYVDSRVELVGVIIEDADIRNDKVFYLLEAKRIEVEGKEQAISGRVRVTVYNTEEVFEYGDVVSVSGILREVEEPGNPGQFNYKKWLERRGIFVVMYVWDENNIEKISTADVSFIKSLAYDLKQKFIEVLFNTLPKEHAGLMQGMLFGERGLITDEMSHDFFIASLIHILCVSGFHVGLVLAGFLGLFYILKLPRALEAPLGSFLLIFYAAMTGFTHSVMRAAVMGIAFLWARQLDRERDWPTAMAIAAAVVLFIWPHALWEPGFQLSFAVTFGILHLTPLAEKLLSNLPRKVRLAVAVPIIAEITAAPLVMYHFNMISLVGFIANITLAPLISAIMLLTGVSVLVGVFFLSVASFINITTSALIDLMLLTVDWLSSLPFAAVFLKPIPWYFVIGFYGFLMLLPALVKKVKEIELKHYKKAAYKLLLSSAVVVLVFICILKFGDREILAVHFIDVGQGDAILIQTPNGKNMLIDAGGKEGELAGEVGVGSRVVLPYLRYYGVNELNVLMITHPHEDHSGGAASIIERMRVEKVMVSPIGDLNLSSIDKDYINLLEKIKEKDIPISYALAGDVIKLDESVDIRILWPDQPQVNLNDNSLVVKLNYKKCSFLFTGDIEEYAQQQLFQMYEDLDCTVLKVPHHGSKFFDYEFLKRTSPEISVISVGKYNKFNHPATELLNALEELNSKVYRTDIDGAIVIRTDGNRVWIKTHKAKKTTVG